MVRLVQIEGMPVSHDLYTSNSAYVDVQLKYTGNPDCGGTEVQRPPRLDICLQQVYYFIITKEQMMSHSLEFQVNTFDDQFRRYVSGMVEVNLREEMGDDILSGAEVVFVKEILEPMRVGRSTKGMLSHNKETVFYSPFKSILCNSKEGVLTTIYLDKISIGNLFVGNSNKREEKFEIFRTTDMQKSSNDI